MDELSQKVLSYLEISKKKLSFSNLKKELEIKGEEQTNVFERALSTLVENGSLFFNTKTLEYETMKNKPDFIVAKLIVDKSGVPYVRDDARKIYIDIENLNGALDGDTVIVTNIYRDDIFKRNHGEIFKILKRELPNLVFEVVGDGVNATLIPPVGYNTHINVELSKKDMKKLKNGQHIIVTVGTEPEDGVFRGEFKEEIKENGDNKLSTIMLAHKFNIETEFSEEALQEARNIPQTICDDELVGRVDLRDKNFFTIDCDNTKDRDDSICVEKLPNGNYKLYTSISHVAHYVKPGSALDKEARRRCTSHYPDNDCIPMLPKELSNGVCSLNGGVDRLAITTEMIINPDGEVVNYNIYRSIINSKKEMKYSDVNKVLDREYVPHLNDFKQDIYLINELSKAIDKYNEKIDRINVDSPETEFVRNDNDSITDIIEKPRGFAEKIIENFMVVTNCCCSEFLSWAPIPYRVHEEPDLQRIEYVLNELFSAGARFDKRLDPDGFNCRKVINDALRSLERLESCDVFKEAIIRSLPRAKYSVDNCGHFALGAYSYSHTTSPIRRYLDLRYQRMLDEVLDKTFDYNKYDEYKNDLRDVCNAMNNAEKVDFDMEKFAEAVNIAEYASKHIGEETPAIVYAYDSANLMVKTAKGVRGVLSFNDMKGCNCHYDSNKKVIIDKKNNTVYRIGDRLLVLYKNSNQGTAIVHVEMVKPKQKVLKKIACN